jgi:hypothetical protein
MRIPIFGESGAGFLSDAKLFVTFKPEANWLRQVFPSIQSENGKLVYSQNLSGSSRTASALIDRVEVESPTLFAIIVSVAVLVLGLIAWIVFGKR